MKTEQQNKISSNLVLPADAVKLALTPKQNAVIFCLQNGWEIITDMEMKGAIIASRKYEYKINGGLFWRLVNMGLIEQSNDWTKHRHGFILTELGKKCITKKVTIGAVK